MSKWGIPWTGYLVPARDGSRLLPDWESSWDVAATVVVVAVTWKFRLTFRPGNYLWSFQIGIWPIWEIFGLWYRGSTQNFEPDWSSRVIWPGEPFWKKKTLLWPHFPKQEVALLENKITNCLAPNVLRSPCISSISLCKCLWHLYKYIELPHFYRP